VSTVAATTMHVCGVDDIPLGEGRAVTLEGRRIAIFRAGGGWYAIDAVCPHRGGPLADGIVCDRAVICPLHDRRFDLKTGAALTTGDGVAAHAVEVRGDRVFVTLAAAEQQRAA
jgi:nitrite reductase (NADH) small subunit